MTDGRKDDDLTLHVAHTGEVAQESAGRHHMVQERGWRRDVDLEVLRASGTGEVMGMHEVIQSEWEFWIVQGQYLISGRFSASYSVCSQEIPIKINFNLSIT